MKENGPEFDLMLTSLKEFLVESLSIDIPYRTVRKEMLAENALRMDKKLFRFHLDRIAIKLLGKEATFREILIDEMRLKEEGEEPTYPLYVGLHPGIRNHNSEKLNPLPD